jgi:hypothetical protein
VRAAIKLHLGHLDEPSEETELGEHYLVGAVVRTLGISSKHALAANQREDFEAPVGIEKNSLKSLVREGVI